MMESKQRQLDEHHHTFFYHEQPKQHHTQLEEHRLRQQIDIIFLGW